MTEASNRSLTFVGFGAFAVILGLQIVILAIWGDAGDPPDAVFTIAFVLFWGAVIAALTVVFLGSGDTWFSPQVERSPRDRP